MNLAGKVFKSYVKLLILTFGETVMTGKNHALLHMAKQVERLGLVPFGSVTAYCFESLNAVFFGVNLIPTYIFIL